MISRTSAAAEEDATLVSQLAGGQMDAAAGLYDRYAAQMLALSRRILRNDGDAEEVVQDVFAQAWRSAADFRRSRGSVAAWLLMMTRSRSIDRLRARTARPDLASDGEAAEQPAGNLSPAEQVLSDEQARRVRDAVSALTAPQREALELAYYEGLTQAEIAARLSQPLGTIKTRMRAALQVLRERLRS